MALSYGAKFMGLMAGLLGFGIAVDVTTMVLAAKTDDGLVDKEYYAHGLHYDPRKEFRANPMGWKVGLEARPETGGRLAVNVTLQEKSGDPLRGAAATLTMFRPTHDGMDQDIALRETTPGHLVGLGKLPANGLWDFTVSIQRGAERFHYRERLNLSGHQS